MIPCRRVRRGSNRRPVGRRQPARDGLDGRAGRGGRRSRRFTPGQGPVGGARQRIASPCSAKRTAETPPNRVGDAGSGVCGERTGNLPFPHAVPTDGRGEILAASSTLRPETPGMGQSGPRQEQPRIPVVPALPGTGSQQRQHSSPEAGFHADGREARPQRASTHAGTIKSEPSRSPAISQVGRRLVPAGQSKTANSRLGAGAAPVKPGIG